MRDIESILNRVEKIDGWFPRDHGSLLYTAARDAILKNPTLPIIEIGSYCGRSTMVLAAAMENHGKSKVYAIDPHEGTVSMPNGFGKVTPSLVEFMKNVMNFGFGNTIELIKKKSCDVNPMANSLLFIDGLHDYQHVLEDYSRFGPRTTDTIAFHDYSDIFKGVMRCVDEAIARREIQMVKQVGSLAITKKCR